MDRSGIGHGVRRTHLTAFPGPRTRQGHPAIRSKTRRVRRLSLPARRRTSPGGQVPAAGARRTLRGDQDFSTDARRVARDGPVQPTGKPRTRSGHDVDVRARPVNLCVQTGTHARASSTCQPVAGNQVNASRSFARVTGVQVRT